MRAIIYWANTMRTKIIIIIIFLSAVSISACGGGPLDRLPLVGDGSSDNFNGPAIVSIDVNPAQIDRGDVTTVTTHISKVHPDGIELKFRYPPELTYVSDSSFLEVDGQQIDVGPTVNKQKNSKKTFLVYFFSQSIFGESRNGILRFQLRGSALLQDGMVAVDPDIDDPTVDNSSEFDVNTTEFAAKDADDIEVIN
ncbi:MAG: hypothetical protein D6719_04680 [Candidatus Dadabacteria bacterium]|nr:MAG: hypothetical protein D6719_04680 [Candidatus Dadabacteria bacterium]